MRLSALAVAVASLAAAAVVEAGVLPRDGTSLAAGGDTGVAARSPGAQAAVLQRRGTDTVGRDTGDTMDVGDEKHVFEGGASTVKRHDMTVGGVGGGHVIFFFSADKLTGAHLAAHLKGPQVTSAAGAAAGKAKRDGNQATKIAVRAPDRASLRVIQDALQHEFPSASFDEEAYPFDLARGGAGFDFNAKFATKTVQREAADMDYN